MPKGRHVKPEEAIAHLADVDRLVAGGMTIGDACRQVGIGRKSYYRWRNVYAGVTVTEAKRAVQVRRENAALKRLVAEQAIKIQALEDVLREKP